MRMISLLLAVSLALIGAGCANKVSRATSIGDDTYIMTTKAQPSPFGVSSSADMGKLIEEASASCTDRALRFVLLEREQVEGNNFKLGNGTVTYKCVK